MRRFVPLSGALIAGCVSALMLSGVGWAGPAPASLDGRLVPLPGPKPAIAAGITHFTSFNWAGYFQTGSAGTFTVAEDTWKVPKITKVPTATTAASDWVGIDGVSSSDLVQDGTTAETFRGKPIYFAWTEILPAPSVNLSLVIKPGDSITALVQEIATNTWLMKVTDNTTKQSGQRTVSYTASESSVEAIHERPCHTAPCNAAQDYAPLASTSKVIFDPGSFSSTAPGGTPVFNPLLVPASGATLNEVVMTNSPTSPALATPSAPDSDRDGFAVADGKAIPPAPPS